jgi:hypothetical protein
MACGADVIRAALVARRRKADGEYVRGAGMRNSTGQELFVRELTAILEETFDTHHGIYLDQGTGLFATLEEISADDASVPIGGGCATLAAQVEHVIFYLQVLSKVVVGAEAGKLDWGEIWARVGAVTSEEWDDLRVRLRDAYADVNQTLGSI